MAEVTVRTLDFTVNGDTYHVRPEGSGTVTGVQVNGTTVSPSYTGVVDIGNVLETDQGISNAGKFLVVGSDGNVVPVSMTAWQGGTY